MFPIHVHDGESEVPDDPILYIIAKDGIYLRKKLGLIESQVKVDKISILEPVETYAAMDIEKIPADLVAQIWTFFADVYDDLRSEVNVLLYYHEENKEYWIRVPFQKVSAAGVSYENFELTMPEYLYIGTIHSHANFGAFHSGTDKNDEANFDGLHITIGDNGKEKRSISASIVVNGARVLVDPSDYMEGITLVETEVPVTSYYSYYGGFFQIHKGRMKHKSETEKPKTRIEKGWVLEVEDELKTYPEVWNEFVEKQVVTYTRGYSNFLGKHMGAAASSISPSYQITGQRQLTMGEPRKEDTTLTQESLFPELDYFKTGRTNYSSQGVYVTGDSRDPSDPDEFTEDPMVEEDIVLLFLDEAVNNTACETCMHKNDMLEVMCTTVEDMETDGWFSDEPPKWDELEDLQNVDMTMNAAGDFSLSHSEQDEFLPASKWEDDEIYPCELGDVELDFIRKI